MWGKPYYDMIDPPRILPIVQELLSDPQYGHVLPGCPPEFAGRIRLDHDNTHFAAPFDPAHGQGTDRNGLEWTPDGIKIGGIHGGDPVTTRTVSVIYELKPLEPGCGGTACLSGTHNSGYPRPDFVARDARHPPWPEDFNVEVVTLNVGEALVFTVSHAVLLVLKTVASDAQKFPLDSPRLLVSTVQSCHRKSCFTPPRCTAALVSAEPCSTSTNPMAPRMTRTYCRVVSPSSKLRSIRCALWAHTLCQLPSEHCTG